MAFTWALVFHKHSMLLLSFSWYFKKISCPLPDDKILTLSKVKVLTDNKLHITLENQDVFVKNHAPSKDCFLESLIQLDVNAKG